MVKQTAGREQLGNFAEEFARLNDDVLFRLARLVEDTVLFTETFTKIREEKEAMYGF